MSAGQSKDVFIIDTKCYLNESIKRAFEVKGYTAEVHTGYPGLPDDILIKANGFTAICIFVDKKIKEEQIEILKENGNKLILCCSAGFDNVPVELCKKENIRIMRVPSYSPSSIAEYAVAAIMALSKNLQRSYEQTKQGNFTIGTLQCLLLEDKKIAAIGTGKIGATFVEKISGLAKEVFCFDAYPNHKWIKGVKNAKYVDLDTALSESDIISIHVPLLESTHHLINKDNIAKMKPGVIIVNTSRGEIINTADLVDGLESGHIRGVALDVFEGEKKFMFDDKGKNAFDQYPDMQKLSDMSNVIISSHVAFYTDESIRQITEKTLQNYEGFIGKIELDEKSIIA